MRTKLTFVTALTFAASAAVASPAHATTVGDCQVLIADLSADTAGATSLGKNGPGLVGKADDASAKLGAGKVGDALFLAPKPKVSEADYATLNTEVASAIACIEGMSALQE